MAPHHTFDLCPRCPCPPGESLYTVEQQPDARHCYLCGYTRPVPPAEAVRLLVIGTGSGHDAQHYYRLRSRVANRPLASLHGLKVDGVILRGWARTLRVNLGGSHPALTSIDRVVVLPHAVVPEPWLQAIEDGALPFNRLNDAAVS